MMDIKKLRHITSVLSLVAMVLLAIVVVRFSRVNDSGFKSIRLDPPKEQVTQKPPTVVNRPERKLVIPEPRRKPSSPVSARPKPEQNPQSLEAEQLEDDDLLRENIPDMLAWAIEVDFPEISLSDSEFRELTETVMTIRATMQGLRGTEGSRENAESIIKKRDQMAQATTDFERITGMNLVEFLLRVPSRGGIDNEEPDNEEIDPEYIDNSEQ